MKFCGRRAAGRDSKVFRGQAWQSTLFSVSATALFSPIRRPSASRATMSPTWTPRGTAGRASVLMICVRRTPVPGRSARECMPPRSTAISTALWKTPSSTALPSSSAGPSSPPFSRACRAFSTKPIQTASALSSPHFSRHGASWPASRKMRPPARIC